MDLVANLVKPVLDGPEISGPDCGDLELFGLVYARSGSTVLAEVSGEINGDDVIGNHGDAGDLYRQLKAWFRDVISREVVESLCDSITRDFPLLDSRQVAGCLRGWIRHGLLSLEPDVRRVGDHVAGSARILLTRKGVLTGEDWSGSR